MKKIKLLTPIFGIAATASILVPLTSCNKDKGGDEPEIQEQAEYKFDPNHPYSSSITQKTGSSTEEDAITAYLDDATQTSNNAIENIILDDLMVYQQEAIDIAEGLGIIRYDSLDYITKLYGVDKTKETISWGITCSGKITIYPGTGLEQIFNIPETSVQFLNIKYDMQYIEIPSPSNANDGVWIVKPVCYDYTTQQVDVTDEWLTQNTEWKIVGQTYDINLGKKLNYNHNCKNYEELLYNESKPEQQLFMIWQTLLWSSHYFENVLFIE